MTYKYYLSEFYHLFNFINNLIILKSPLNYIKLEILKSCSVSERKLTFKESFIIP